MQITIGTDPVAARLGQVIQSMEKAVGIDVELDADRVRHLAERGPTPASSTASRSAGRAASTRTGTSTASSPRTGTLNDSGYSNPKLDYILNSARKSVTEKSRITLYTAAMKIIHRQRPLIYLYHPVNYYGVTKKVTGVQVFGDGLIRAYNAGYVK